MIQHKSLFDGRWAKMTLMEQMANIGSEIDRVRSWKRKGDSAQSDRAFDRAIELLDMSKMSAQGAALKELCRLKENVCYHYLNYDETEWNRLCKYFDFFAIAWRMKSHRPNDV
ncbi:MAG: hypothetical protein LBQ31_07355 [Bacteroidales bacterium]|jgi:hypothetical protein|nr:hypothetical protein [Bacteroidales bacterium]